MFIFVVHSFSYFILTVLLRTDAEGGAYCIAFLVFAKKLRGVEAYALNYYTETA